MIYATNINYKHLKSTLHYNQLTSVLQKAKGNCFPNSFPAEYNAITTHF